MSQFLKKRAKLIYILMFAISLFVFVSSTVYITAYNYTAVDYDEAVLNDNTTYYVGKNTNLYGFVKDLTKMRESGIKEATLEFSYGDFVAGKVLIESDGFTETIIYDDYKILYYTMFDFNQTLQRTNNLLFYLGMFSLIMVAIMLICANASRRKYYISNLVSGVICPLATIIFTVFVILSNLNSMSFLGEHYEALNWGATASRVVDTNQVIEWFINKDTSHFQINNDTLITYIIILGAFIICNGLLITYNVFRYLDTRKQLKLEGLGD